MSRKLENLVGRRFGNLVVKDYAGLRPIGKTKQSYWTCHCDCGKDVVVSNNNLKRGRTNSCGCYQKQRASEANLNDLTGQKFGDLTVLEFANRCASGSSWLCQCECGNKATVSTSALRAGQKSCGCKQGWWRSTNPGLWKDPAAYARWRREDPVLKLRNQVSTSIRAMIKHNGGYKRKKSIRNYLHYTIEELKHHLESLWEPWMSWDNYGGRSDDPRQTWHIHHIKPHSTFSYTSMNDPLFTECWALSNLMPLEKLENIARGNKSPA
jgi:hypothetical protein